MRRLMEKTPRVRVACGLACARMKPSPLTAQVHLLLAKRIRHDTDVKSASKATSPSVLSTLLHTHHGFGMVGSISERVAPSIMIKTEVMRPLLVLDFYHTSSILFFSRT
jgi:hypothetical protein